MEMVTSTVELRSLKVVSPVDFILMTAGVVGVVPTSSSSSSINGRKLNS